MNINNFGTLLGRRLELFTSVTGENDQCDAFAVHYPKDYCEGKKYPLYVIFHSAGHDVFSTLSCMMYKGNHDIYHTPDDMFGLILDCRASEATDWWWGGVNAMGDGDPVRHTAIQPVEHRAIATVEWAMKNYPIDTDRVYAVGNSMGGSGALGIALCRGDVFAAIKVNVPAGVRHATDRCGLDSATPENLPDPPVLVDYSAQNDEWSTGHEILYRGMREKRYAFHGFWGLFGHGNNDEAIAEYNDMIHSVPVFTVKKSEAYPVFTNASADDKNPWEHKDDHTDSGQVNGFFRFENVSDSANEFKMVLWLVNPGEWKTRVTLPESSTADLLIRRIRGFKLRSGEKFKWTLADEDGSVTEGTGYADALGHPSIDGIRITQKKQILTLER